MRSLLLLSSIFFLLSFCAAPSADVQPTTVSTTPEAALPPLGDRAAWYARLQWTQECEQDHRENPPAQGSGLQLYSIGQQQYLVEIECFRAAYQASYNFMLYDLQNLPGRATLIRFPVFDGDRWHLETAIAGLPAFNPKTKELAIFSKARGMGDCGQLLRYRFPAGAPELMEVRARNCSPDLPTDKVPPPQDWPLVPLEAIPKLQ